MSTLLQDVRYAIRNMGRSPGALLVALLSLGLGIGASTAIFSVVYGALIDPFPYRDVHGMWVPHLDNVTGRGARYVFSRRELLALQKFPAVQDAAGITFADAVLGSESAPETIRVVSLSPNMFTLLGVEPLLGRTIGPHDVGPGGRPEHVVVLSYAAWRKIFAGDARAVGQTVRLDNEPYTVIGVMPPRFTWFGRDSVWAPLDMDPGGKQPTMIRMRLKPGVSSSAGVAGMQSLFDALARENPKDYPRAGFRVALTNFMDQTVATFQLQKTLYILLGAVSFLLLIGCANVANLLLARATARRKEIAVRAALGAGRRRLARQMLTESLLLAAGGGALGVLIAFAALKSIVALIPDIYIPNEAVISVNRWVLLFSIAVSAATGILFGMAPALQAARADLIESLKDASKGSSTGGRGARTRNALVVVEVALSAMLLLGAALTMRTFLALTSTSLGFEPANLLLLTVVSPEKRFATGDQMNAVFDAILERLRALPGVRAATAGNGGFPFAGPGSAYTAPGRPAEPDRRVSISFVGDGYLDAMRTPLLSGRPLSSADVARKDRVALINQTAARQVFGEENPVGRQMTLNLLQSAPPAMRMAEGPPVVTVVGVIGDARNNGIQQPPLPGVFLPYSVVAPSRRVIAVRTDGDPLRLTNAIRTAIAGIDNGIAVARTDKGEDVLESQVMGPRFTMVLFLVFAGVGLVLAGVGIYSVLAYTVSRRANEIGIRMALGAQRGSVIALIIGAGLKLALAGIVAGLLASAALSRFLEAQLYGVKRLDLVSYVGVAVVLAAIAALACYVPSLRATRIDPATSLRTE